MTMSLHCGRYGTADAMCPTVGPTSPDVYVNTAALLGGHGSMACPFRTLAEAAAVPLMAGVNRTVHVQAC